MAMVRMADGYVENVIVVDPASDFQPPDGYALIDAADAHVAAGDWFINGAFLPARFDSVTVPNSAAVNSTVMITATLPAGSPDSSVTFHIEGGTAYQEPVTGGQASHAYAFALPGTYRVIVSSAHHGQTVVEVVVQ